MTTTFERANGSITAPLREEHVGLLPHIEALRSAADAVGDLSTPDLLERVNDAHRFLREHLIVHATAEDAALYPVVEKFIGGGATATMARDHVEVVRMTGELAGARDQLVARGLSAESARELRRLLYGLYAVVRLHFAKEEEVYLPLLDAGLTTEAAEAMFVGLHQAAAEAAAAAG